MGSPLEATSPLSKVPDTLAVYGPAVSGRTSGALPSAQSNIMGLMIFSIATNNPGISESHRSTVTVPGFHHLAFRQSGP